MDDIRAKKMAAARLLASEGLVHVPSATGRDLKPGDVLGQPGAERYLVGEPIAQGGTGRILRAWPLDAILQRDVPEVLGQIAAETGILRCGPQALAVLSDLVAGEPPSALKVLTVTPEMVGGQTEWEKIVERFMQEHRVLKALRGQVLQLLFALDTVRRAPIPYFLVEYIVGETLAAHIKKLRAQHGCVPWFTLSLMFGDMLDAVEPLHKRGIIHRDLTDLNFFMRQVIGARERVVTLLDLGIAKVLTAIRMAELGLASSPERAVPATQALGLTADGGGVAMGSALVMPEEQFRNKEITPATDVFTLAAIIFEAVDGRSVYEAVTGQPIPSDPDPRDLLRVARADLPPFRQPHPQLGPRANEALHRLLRRMRHPVPAQRPQDIAEVRRGLGRVREIRREEGAPST